MQGAYCFLTTSGESADRYQVIDVWHKHIPSEVFVFVWRLLRSRLSTKDNMAQLSILSHTDVVCVSGCGSRETATHLFCSHVWLWLGISSVSFGDLHQHFIHFINMAGLPRSTHMFFKII